MPRKPGSMYREVSQMAYTRREYMGGVPGSRITQFDMGNSKANFPVEMTLVADETCQIRHIALEAARISATRVLTKYAGATGFHLKVRLYPHHVLRENKQASGAGADRVSQGMRGSFGKAVGTAARVTPGRKIMTVKCQVEHFQWAKDALRKANMKLPTPCHILVERGAELVQ
ncbi:MAG: 50S ribosomal protein L16 [Euryarchaeota archaeon]|nr:50S ribosomal protein L16 [Euryarchaeota archaeon]